MTYSYTQISQYLTCPRRYRHRYLDGWKEKDTRAAMLSARLRTGARALFSAKIQERCCSPRMVGIRARTCTFQPRLVGSHAPARTHAFLTGSARTIVSSVSPDRDLQIKFTRPIGGSGCRLPTSTPSGNSTARPVCSSGKPARAAIRRSRKDYLSLDPQLVCYSWITGIADVAQVVFVRKSLVEVQYLRTTITADSAQSSATWWRARFGDRLSGLSAHSGTRFPQNPVGAVRMGSLSRKATEIARHCCRTPPRSRTLGWLDELNFEAPRPWLRSSSRRTRIVVAKIDEILGLGATERKTELDTSSSNCVAICAGFGGTVLEAGESEVVRRVSGGTVSRFPKEGVLPDVDTRHLPPQARKDLKEVGWTKGMELVKLARRDRQHLDVQRVAQSPSDAEGGLQEGGRAGTSGNEKEPWENIYWELYRPRCRSLRKRSKTATLIWEATAPATVWR